MSVAAAIENLRARVLEVGQIRISEIKNSRTGIGEWPGLSYEEYVERVEFVANELNEFVAHQPLEKLPYSTIVRVTKAAEAFVRTTTTFINERNAENYYLAADAVDEAYTVLNSLGLSYPGNGMAKLRSLVLQIEPELGQLKKANENAHSLEESLRSLLTPTVSNALAVEFKARSDGVKKTGYFWAVLSLIVAIAALSVTGYSLHEITSAISKQFDSKGGNSIGLSTDWMLIAEIALRSAILIPLYVFFALCFAQYSKERAFEEEYAHKAAIAATLPNYRELARNEDVRDRIVSNASDVIFSPPLPSLSKADLLGKTPEVMKGLEGIINSIERMTSKK